MVCAHCGTVFCDDQCDWPPDAPATPKRFCIEACKQAYKQHRQSRRYWARRACAEQDKPQYADMAEARSAAARVYRERRRVLYPYECPCGRWHLTRDATNKTGSTEAS